MQLIDTHAHIYLPEFDAERKHIIDQGAHKGLSKILMPAIDSTTHDLMIGVETEFEMTLAMMGLHPCSVKENFERELNTVQEWLLRRSFYAIGEIGLDFYWDKTFTGQQYRAFHQQIEWALNFHLPIVIHSRNATDECIDVVKQYPQLRGVFHCFSGTAEQAQKVIELHFFLGIGGVLTFKNSGLDAAIQHIGLEHLILETDAPYLAPVPFRGKRNEPGYITYVALKLAELKKIEVAEVATITTANAINLFNLR